MTPLWMRRAKSDLRGLRAYIAQDDPNAAGAVAERILKAVDRLLRHPMLGRAVPGADDRELTIPRTSYIIRYAIEGETLKILAIPHERQNR